MDEDCVATGRAAVSVDGAAREVVDTYSADDIWGVRIYRKDLAAGSHRLRMRRATSGAIRRRTRW